MEKLGIMGPHHKWDSTKIHPVKGAQSAAPPGSHNGRDLLKESLKLLAGWKITGSRCMKTLVDL